MSTMVSPNRVFAAAVVVAGLIPALASAAFVLFSQSFGAWSVVCWKDEASNRVTCSADAPPTTLDAIPDGVVRVSEAASGAFTISVEMRADVAPGGTVRLAVDGDSAQRLTLGVDYVARLDGVAAGSLVAAMLEGRELDVGAAGYAGRPDVAMAIPLDSFPEAFEAMRVNLRRRGAIRDP